MYHYIRKNTNLKSILKTIDPPWLRIMYPSLFRSRS